MDPEIVPGRTRGVKMGESSGKYYLRTNEGTFIGLFILLFERTKVHIFIIIRTFVRGYVRR